MTGAAGNFRDKFSNTDVSTFAFILLTVASAGLWSSFWLYGFVKSINRHAGKTKIPVALPVIVITGFSWSTVMLSVDPFDYGQMLIAKILSLMAGVLGLHPDDERLRYSRLLAQEAGVEYTIRFVGEPPTHYDYANMARIRIESHDGRVTDVLGASIGGGNILITEINGLEVEFTGEYPTLIVRHNDQPGVICRVTAVLADAAINVAGMKVFRHSRGQDAYMIIETDTHVAPHVQEAVFACSDNILAIRAIDNQ